MRMFAEPAVQLVGRQTTTYRGGWPQGYVAGTCSGDAPVKCQPNSMYPLNCCPSGQRCSGGWPVHCCPDDDADCESVALRLPVCANSTWNMYKLQRTGWFCCPKDMVGIITPDEWTGICQEKSLNIPATMLHTVVAQFGASPATSVGNSPTDTLNPGKGGGSEDTSSVGAGGGGSNDDGTANPADSGGGSGMSAGSIAGIVIGSIAFFGLVAALILWAHRRSLRKNPPAGSVGAGNGSYDASKPHPGPDGGDAPEVVQYTGSPNHTHAAAVPMVYSPLPTVSPQESTPMGYNPHQTVSPQGFTPMGYNPHHVVSPQNSAPAYSPTQGISEVNGVSRAEMDVPRSSNYY